MKGRTEQLLPITKLVLAVSAIVQLVFGVEGLLAPQLVRILTWPPPFEPIPDLWLRYDGITFLAMSVGAAFALTQDNWIAARTYLAIGGPMVAAQFVLTVFAGLAPGGAPPIAWAYVVLAFIYLPVVAWVWNKQSALSKAVGLTA